MGIPTKPNKTGKATAADTVQTRDESARWILNYFNPIGIVLDPSAGANVFFDRFKNQIKYRCEIKDGTDFLKWQKHVDWIITNPPYSIYDLFLRHAFEIADNVVFFVPIAKAFKSNKVQEIVERYGGLKEIVYMGSGARHGFGFGFPVGCLYYKKDYHGDCKITHKIF